MPKPFNPNGNPNIPNIPNTPPSTNYFAQFRSANPDPQALVRRRMPIGSYDAKILTITLEPGANPGGKGKPRSVGKVWFKVQFQVVAVHNGENIHPGDRFGFVRDAGNEYAFSEIRSLYIAAGDATFGSDGWEESDEWYAYMTGTDQPCAGTVIHVDAWASENTTEEGEPFVNCAFSVTTGTEGNP